MSESDDPFGLLESSAECDSLSKGLICFGSIVSSVPKCAEVLVNPAEIVNCVETAIGAGNSCFPCVCYVVEHILGDGYC